MISDLSDPPSTAIRQLPELNRSLLEHDYIANALRPSVSAAETHQPVFMQEGSQPHELLRMLIEIFVNRLARTFVTSREDPLDPRR